MKNLKIVLILALLLISYTASAQFSFGVRTGFNLSNASVGPVTPDYKQGIRPGINIGPLAEYMLNDNIGFQAGLFFSTTGYKKYDEKTKGTQTARIENRIHLNTIQFPVHFAYKFNFANDLKLSLHAGPYTSYIASGKLYAESSLITKVNNNVSTVIKTDKSDLYDEPASLDRLDAGLGLGIAIEKSHFFVDLGYDLGFVNILKEAQNDNSIQPRNLYLSFGYKF